MDDPDEDWLSIADRRCRDEDRQLFMDRLDSTDGNEAPLQAALANSMFFITKKGAIGRGVAETQVGDVAFVLYGGKVAFVGPRGRWRAAGGMGKKFLGRGMR